MQQCLPDQPVRHRRNAKLALATFLLRDRHPSHGLDRYVSRSSCLHICGHVMCKCWAGPGNIQPICLRRAFIGFDTLPPCCRFPLVSAASSSADPMLSVSGRGLFASSLTESYRLHRALLLPAPLAQTSDVAFSIDMSLNISSRSALRSMSAATTTFADFSLQLNTVALSDMRRDLPKQERTFVRSSAISIWK